MPAKLLLIILSAALTAAGLLVARQRRLETAGAMSRIHAQISQHERALWEMRCEIARRCRPDEIRRMIDALPEEWVSIPEPRPRPGVPVDDPAATPADLDGEPAGPAGPAEPAEPATVAGVPDDEETLGSG